MAASGNTKASGKKLASNPSHQIWKDSDCRCERRMDASKGGQAVSHIVDAHVAYIKAIADLSRDKAELLERIKRLEEMYEGVI